MSNNDAKVSVNRFPDGVNGKNSFEIFINAARLCGGSSILKIIITAIAGAYLIFGTKLSITFLWDIFIYNFPSAIDCFTALIKVPQNKVSDVFRKFHIIVVVSLVITTSLSFLFIIFIAFGICTIPDLNTLSFKFFNIFSKIPVFFCILGYFAVFICDACIEGLRIAKIK